jgi:hypothetical protein
MSPTQENRAARPLAAALALGAIAALAAACPPGPAGQGCASCGDGPVPRFVCQTPPSADLPRGVQLIMPRPAARPHAAPSDSNITFNVSIDDAGLFTPWHAQIHSHIQAAGALWARVLGGSGSIEVVVRPFNGPRAGGRSLASVHVGSVSGVSIWMQGAAAELRFGVDPNGSGYDMEIVFGQDLQYLGGELWFDPDPVSRTAPVPSNRTDAMSVFLHEMGHAWGFNGWRDWTTGQAPAGYMSSFDRWVDLRPQFWFTGPGSIARWGMDVALTNGNIFHYGNAAPGPGSALIPYLMNGVVFYRGTRYHISDLELATLADSGVLLAPCYANCDQSATAPVLNVDDFTCFINRFAQAQSLPPAQQVAHYANCDGSTAAPVLNVDDFTCFINRYAAGCP